MGLFFFQFFFEPAPVFKPLPVDFIKDPLQLDNPPPQTFKLFSFFLSIQITSFPAIKRFAAMISKLDFIPTAWHIISSHAGKRSADAPGGY